MQKLCAIHRFSCLPLPKFTHSIPRRPLNIYQTRRVDVSATYDEGDISSSVRESSIHVEQLTLNQRVQGSSPWAPTNKIKNLDGRSDLQENRMGSWGNQWGNSSPGRQAVLCVPRTSSALIAAGEIRWEVPGATGPTRSTSEGSPSARARVFEAYPRPRSGKVPQRGETIHPYAGSRTHRTGPWPTYSKLANRTSNSGLIQFGWSDRNRVMNRYLLPCLLPSIAIG